MVFSVPTLARPPRFVVGLAPVKTGQINRRAAVRIVGIGCGGLPCINVLIVENDAGVEVEFAQAKVEVIADQLFVGERNERHQTVVAKIPVEARIAALEQKAALERPRRNPQFPEVGLEVLRSHRNRNRNGSRRWIGFGRAIATAAASGEDGDH